jgi:pimeloyl-ACP methyl ester carboxylesterase
MPPQFAELSTSVTLEYVEQGEPAGAPVLMLHGGTDSWHSFELVLPHLSPSIRAFALSMRGHGDSSRPASGYRYDDFAGDVAAFMDTLGLESSVIVGHSMGRAVAQRFAADYPSRVSALVLLGAFAGEPGNPAVIELEKTVSSFVDPIDPEFVREFQVSTLAQPVPATFLETVIAESMKVPARVWREMFLAIRDDDAFANVGRIIAPTLVVSGGKDGFAGATDVERGARAIPRARLVVYPEAGHGLHWEEPARFAADLEDFIGQAGISS